MNENNKFEVRESRETSNTDYHSSTLTPTDTTTHMRKQPNDRETLALKGSQAQKIDQKPSGKLVVEDPYLKTLIEIYDANEKRSSPMTEIVVNTKEI